MDGVAGVSDPPKPDEGAPVGPGPGSRTALAAASYTLVAAAQKASGFILLIAFTRVLTPTEYGQVALLTTVGALLVLTLSLGLEPRITFAYFRAGEHLPEYLRIARRLSIFVPLVVAAVAAAVIALTPVPMKQAWIMEAVGSCLLAAGTTYPYAVLRSARRVAPYMALALTILVTQVATRVVMVAVLDWGATGWAASDLAGGVVAVVIGHLTVRKLFPVRAGGDTYTSWGVLREGLPLVPHYLAQWGLSLSDRLILALFVTTAAVGIYSALYQIAAVTSLLLNEINRAFMPMYARNAPGSPQLPPLVRDHLRVAFIVHVAFLLFGFAAIEIVLPPAYRAHAELFPLLALSALVYGLYFVPMNSLTLVAGVTSRAPVISLTALAVNVGLNVALDSIWGLWGAVVATALGYTALTLIALGFESRTHAILWRSVLGHQRWINLAYAGVIAATVLATWAGAVRIGALTVLAALMLTLVAVTLVERRHRGTAAV